MGRSASKPGPTSSWRFEAGTENYDPDWRTLKRWWLDTGDRDLTSVSFLIDRQGVIRHIHPGGQYVKGDKAYAGMKVKIEELLREKLMRGS